VGFDFVGGRRRGHCQEIDYFALAVVIRIPVAPVACALAYC
jgi:hypothetical protein